MPTSVKLTVLGGPLDGKELVFTERSLCTVGRSHTCCLQLPAAFSAVSRKHCLFEIDPPDVRVRDLASLNGTFVNDTRIGQGTTEKTSRAFQSQPVTLKDVDRVKVGPLVLGVSIGQPVEKTEPRPSLQSRPMFSFPELTT